jgi:hypothetical protein
VGARVECLPCITPARVAAGPVGDLGMATDGDRSGRGGLLGSSGSTEAAGRVGSEGGDITDSGSVSGSDSCRVAVSLISM